MAHATERGKLLAPAIRLFTNTPALQHSTRLRLRRNRLPPSTSPRLHSHPARVTKTPTIAEESLMKFRYLTALFAWLPLALIAAPAPPAPKSTTPPPASAQSAPADDRGMKAVYAEKRMALVVGNAGP
jgi:hypothetical protein